MCDVPHLIRNFQFGAPQRGHHQCEQREDGNKSEDSTQWHFAGLGECKQFRVNDKHDQRMHDHQRDGEERNPPMEMIDDILTPRFGDVTEARRESELQAHDRQSGITERR